MASVRKRPWTHNGVTKEKWVVEYTDQSGKRRRFTPKSGLKKDADRERLRIENEIESGTHTSISETVTVSVACTRFLEDCESRWKRGDKMAGQTLLSYRQIVATSIEPFIGSRKLSTLTPDDVQSFFNTLAETYAPSTARARAIAFCLVMKFAARKKWVRAQVWRDPSVRKPPPARQERVIPSKAEIKVLMDSVWTLGRHEELSAAINRNAVLCLGVFAGLRPGEMCGLQWENVDFDSRLIRVRHNQSKVDGLKGPKSRAGRRDIPMSEPVYNAMLECLRFWQAYENAAAIPGLKHPAARCRREVLSGSALVDLDAPRTGYVIRSLKSNGTALKPEHICGGLWNPLMEKAGLMVKGEDGKLRPKFSIHALRHANVSLLIERGLPPIHLRTVIGHASVNTTYAIYGHLFPEDKQTHEAVTHIASELGATRARQEFVTI